MSWLYSQALVAEYSAENSLGGEQSAPLSVMPTPHKFSRNDKTMEPCKLSQFGLTCEVLTASHGEELLTSFLAGFHARTSVLQEKAQELPASALASGKSLRGLLAKYDRNTRSLKTAQLSLIEDSTPCLVTLPRTGTMQNGCVYQRGNVGLTTNETGYGFLPTLAALGGAKSQKWPTPKAGDANKRGNFDATNPRNGLPAAVKRFSTTMADTELVKCDSKNRPDYQDCSNGQLNPAWVEWLMGWPIGWTALELLETDKCQEWQRSHLTSSCGGHEIKSASLQTALNINSTQNRKRAKTLSESGFEDTKDLLEAWGVWVRTESVVRHMQYRNPLASYTASSGGIGASDEKMLRVDKAVGKLCNKCPQTGQAVMFYYRGGRNVSKVAIEMGVERKKTGRLIDSGIAWIDGALKG